jgi:hypothetical protein
MGRNARPALAQPESLLREQEMATFSYASIFKANSAADIKAIQPKTSTRGNSEIIRISPCIYLPAYIAINMLDYENVPAEDLTLYLKGIITSRLLALENEEDNEISEVTISHESDSGEIKVSHFSSKTCREQGGDVLQWLMAFKHPILPSVKLHTPLSGNLVQDAAANAEMCRLGPLTVAPTPSNTGNDERAALSEHFEQLKDVLQGATDQLIDKTVGSKVQDKLFLSMLQAAASTDGENPGNVSITALDILKTKNLDDKRTLFMRQLGNIGSEDVALSSSQSKSFVQGPWHWAATKPDGISMLLMSAPGVDNDDAVENDFIISTKLHLKMTDKITEKEFRKYTDKSVKTPSSFYECIEVMQLQCDCLEVCLGDSALVVEQYAMFLLALKENKILSKMRTNIRGDKHYIGKLMHKTDQILNNFFAECYKHSENVTAIDFEELDFDQLVSKIRKNELYLDVMPPFFKQLTSEPDTDQGMFPKTNNEDGPPSKKRKTPVINESPNADWSLQANEDFEKVFNKAPQSAKPSKMCLKYWIKNECAQGCNKAKSHHVVTATQKKEMNYFVKYCRKCE